MLVENGPYEDFVFERRKLVVSIVEFQPRCEVVLGEVDVFADLIGRVATTWVADAFDVAPYLLVTGPEKRTGKSRLLETIALLVRTPILAASITEAALFRIIDAQSPTVLIDELAPRVAVGRAAMDV